VQVTVTAASRSLKDPGKCAVIVGNPSSGHPVGACGWFASLHAVETPERPPP